MACNGNGSVFVGSTTTLALARSLGALGAILGIANTEPDACVAAWDGDEAAQRASVASSGDADRQFPQDIKLTAERLGVNASIPRSRSTTYVDDRPASSPDRASLPTR